MRGEVSCGPNSVPAKISAQSAELAEGVTVSFGPPSAGFLDTGLMDVAVGAFRSGLSRRADRARRRGHSRVGGCDCRGSGARRARGPFRPARCRAPRGAAAWRLAQRREKRFGVGRVWCGGGEIIADVKQIDGVAARLPKLQPGLFGDPRCAVAQGVNLAVECLARLVRGLHPAQAGVGHVVPDSAEVGVDPAVGGYGDKTRLSFTDLAMFAPLGPWGAALVSTMGTIGPSGSAARCAGPWSGRVRTGWGARAASTWAWCSVAVRTRVAGTLTRSAPALWSRRRRRCGRRRSRSARVAGARAAPRLHLGGGAKQSLGVLPMPLELLD